MILIIFLILRRFLNLFLKFDQLVEALSEPHSRLLRHFHVIVSVWQHWCNLWRKHVIRYEVQLPVQDLWSDSIANLRSILRRLDLDLFDIVSSWVFFTTSVHERQRVVSAHNSISNAISVKVLRRWRIALIGDIPPLVLRESDSILALCPLSDLFPEFPH